MARKQNRAQRGVQQRRARAAAIQAAQRRRARRQRLIIGVIAAAIIGGLVVVFVLMRDDDDKTDLATDTTSTTAGKPKPCVKRTDPLPAGAPEVDVAEGPAPTELVTRDLKVGTGAEVVAGSQLTVNYIGVTCSTGKIFDSTYSRGQPASFALAGVIPGWQDGIPGMKIGGQRLLGIPPAMAYGEAGRPDGGIGPNEALWFVVDIVDAKPPAAATTTTAPS